MTRQEQSTADIWAAIAHCSRTVLARSGIAPAQVRGIGFDATCSLVVLDAATDAPISVCGDFSDPARNVMLWMDHRAGAETRAINATGHGLLRYVGGGMSIEMEIPKVLWLKKHMPAADFARAKFFDLADALTHLATGADTRSFCSAVCKQGFVPVGVDGSVKGWQPDFLRAVGLGDLVDDGFARIGGGGDGTAWASAGAPVGWLSAQAAADLGLHTRVRIGSGVIDAYAGWIGSVGAGGGPLDAAFHRLAAVAGTSTCHLVMSRAPVFVPGVWGPYRDVLVPGMWMAEGGQSSTGSLLHNVLTTHPAYAEALARAGGDEHGVFGFLAAHLETLRARARAPTIAHLAKHLFVYGDKHGNRSPIADPAMRGAVVGLSFDVSVDDLALQYYGAMEFVALQTRHIVDTLNAAGHDVRSVYMSGGQCKNKLLMQLIADATRMDVVLPRYENDAVVLGAAMLGAVAAGEGKEGLWEVMGRMAGEGGTVRPAGEGAARRLLEAKYRVFLQMAEAQREYRRIVDEALAEA